MVFSNEDKILIKRLRELKGYGSRRFLREFPTKNWTRRGLDNLLAGRTGSTDRVEGSGHWARDTVAFLERKTSDFISPTLWPPNSLDLNLVDYIIWSVLQKVYHSRIITGLEELKTSLIDEWAQLDQSIIDAAVDQWRCHLWSMHLSLHAGHISSINSDNVEPICRGTALLAIFQFTVW